MGYIIEKIIGSRRVGVAILVRKLLFVESDMTGYNRLVSGESVDEVNG